MSVRNYKIYRVRIGTFNVNGKLPSQDLSPWIRPQRQRGTTLPPLKAVSPLSVSALYKGDYLSAGRNDDESNDDAEELSDHLNEADPDIIVLGFQELDLSTEALIYSYTTTREDAWVEAILASLGEVRDQYTKVGVVGTEDSYATHRFNCSWHQNNLWECSLFSLSKRNS